MTIPMQLAVAVIVRLHTAHEEEQSDFSANSAEHVHILV